MSEANKYEGHGGTLRQVPCGCLYSGAVQMSPKLLAERDALPRPDQRKQVREKT